MIVSLLTNLPLFYSRELCITTIPYMVISSNESIPRILLSDSVFYDPNSTKIPIKGRITPKLLTISIPESCITSLWQMKIGIHVDCCTRTLLQSTVVVILIEIMVGPMQPFLKFHWSQHDILNNEKFHNYPRTRNSHLIKLFHTLEFLSSKFKLRSAKFKLWTLGYQILSFGISHFEFQVSIIEHKPKP